MASRLKSSPIVEMVPVAKTALTKKDSRALAPGTRFKLPALALQKGLADVVPPADVPLVVARLVDSLIRPVAEVVEAGHPPLSVRWVATEPTPKPTEVGVTLRVPRSLFTGERVRND